MDNPLVQPDPGLYVWTIIIFLVLLFLLMKFAWKPLLAMLEKREDNIRHALLDAEKARDELANVKEDTEKLLSEARNESQAIVTASKKNAERMKDEIIEKAQTKSDALLAEVKKQIQVEKDRAITDVRAEVVNLSMEVAQKLIKKNLTKEDNLKLINDSLSSINPKNEA
ncbi:MAG: F0F1 ATP synthase subunit B [Candidatus Marinimicrobia bacterium]|nr:F0F1 ATP synthase subunit B [Candidatus Neomarinimicrobiota bacterium]